MIFIKDAHYIDNYKINILFNTNEEKVIDLENILTTDHRSIFRELTDITKFQDFKVDMDTVVWKNGLDLAPEFLYNLS